MVLRRVIGLIILALIIIVGTVLYFVLKNRVSDVESELNVMQKKDIPGKG